VVDRVDGPIEGLCLPLQVAVRWELTDIYKRNYVPLMTEIGLPTRRWLQGCPITIHTRVDNLMRAYQYCNVYPPNDISDALASHNRCCFLFPLLGRVS